jgi:hypothetical protein
MKCHIIIIHHPMSVLYSQAWHPKMKPGSILMFNDYGAGAFPGVKKAVDEFGARINRKVECCQGSGNVWIELSK